MPSTEVVNLGQVFGKDDATRIFAERYFRVQHTDLLFANAAIFVEGVAERMLVPLFIERDFETLDSRYVSFLDIGGSHAHRLKPLVEKLRKICMALPEANERLSHGEPTWFAGKGKVFAMLDDHHHGAAHLSVHLPQPPGIQQALIDTDPERFFRPPYTGPSGWVGVVLDTRPDWDMVERLVLDAYLHVASAKLRAKLVG